jgi:hypothetical protein
VLNSLKRLGFFSYATGSRPALRPIHLPIQWVMKGFYPGVKWPGHEADHSHLYSAEIMNVWRYASTHPYVFMARFLIKHRDNINLPKDYTSLMMCIQLM